MQHFRPVLALADLPPGAQRKVTVNYQDVLIFHLEDGVFAMSALCPHARGPLEKGAIRDGLLTCPWHNWQFDVRTGQHQLSGTIRQPGYATRVEEGTVWIDIESGPE